MRKGGIHAIIAENMVPHPSLIGMYVEVPSGSSFRNLGTV